MAKPMQETISYLLVQAAKDHRNHAAASLRELGLRIGQDMMLSQLWKEAGLTQSELVERLGVEPATVSKVLSRMESGGLASRRRDPEDARLSRVYLTERGRSLRQPVYRAWEQIEDRMLEDFTLEERILLRRLLVQARQNLSRTPRNVHPP